MKRFRIQGSAAARLLAFTIAGAVLLAAPAVAAETGSIIGGISDERGHATNVGNAVVFLMDAESGLPIVKATRTAFKPAEWWNDNRNDPAATDFWYSEVDQRGVFEFKDVPVGRYRLIAQGWSGTKGLPPLYDSSGPAFMFKNPSATVVLHGVTENVEVKAGEQTMAAPRALGRSVLRILNDPEEAHAFLLISLKPRLGPGVLGPVTWGPEFLKGLIGYTQMEVPHVTIIGLPENMDVHVGLMNYDNSPGIGGETYRVEKYTEGHLAIYAGWSNGKFEPPPELLPLTDHLDRNNLTADSVLGVTGKPDEIRDEMSRLLREEPDRKVQVGDLGEFRVLDVLTASAHRELRKSHEGRRKKQK